MRHGEAGEAPLDVDRALTAKGHAQARASAEGLVRLQVKVPVIHHSPYLRACETAAVVAAVFGARLVVSDGLTPSSSPELALASLLKLRHGAFVVAHVPILPALAELLCGARLHFPTAGVAQIVVHGGTGVLDRLWSCEELERVS